MERERELFLSSFGCLSNDFSFIKEYLLHTVVVALESNALSFFREKERKKESAEKKKKKKKTRERLWWWCWWCFKAFSDLDFTTLLTRKDEVEVVLKVERERERTRAIGRVSDAEEEFVRGVRDRNDEEEEEDVVVSRG